MKGKSEIQMLYFKIMVAVLAGLPGTKGLYQPVKVDSKAIQDFVAFYHILKQQSPLKCISCRIMLYSGQIPTHAGFGLLREQGAELIHAKLAWYLLQSA